MLRKSLLSLAVCGALVACGGDDSMGTEHDGGTTPGNDAGHSNVDGGSTQIDAGTADAGMTITQLKSGTYTVSNIVKLDDGCELAFEDTQHGLKTLQLTNKVTSIALGTYYDTTPATGSVISFMPAGYALGSNTYADAGAGVTSLMSTLTTNATVTYSDDMCSFSTARTSLVTITANNTAHVDYTETQSMQNSKCKASAGESTSTCTSHYTFDLAWESN